MDLLTTDVSQLADWTLITPVGQLDVATAPGFRQQLVEAQLGEGRRVLVDLDGVEFIDSMGLGVLVGGVKRARSRDGEFRVRCTRPRLLQLLALTRLDEVFSLTDTVEEVVGG